MRFQTADITATLANHKKRAVGKAGELLVKRLFVSAGFDVQPGERGRGDLIVTCLNCGQRLYVEVKTSRRCCDGRWHFTLRKKGCTDHRNADYVVLVQVMNSGRAIPYVVPIEIVRYQQQAVISTAPEKYRGKFLSFMQQGKLSLQEHNHVV